MKTRRIGDQAYYSLGNFTQRLEFIEATTRASLSVQKHKDIAEAIFDRISRIWKSRNRLIHSHYVYASFFDDGSSEVLVSLGRSGTLGAHPSTWGAAKVSVGRNGGPRETVARKATQSGFAYRTYDGLGVMKYVPVNKGTFQSHAAQLSKRGLQIRALRKAIDSGRARLRK